MRILSFWVFLLAAILAGIFAYSYVKNSKKPNLKAISVLPDSCLVYFNSYELSELNTKLNSQSLIFDQLKSIEEINYSLNAIQELDSILQANESISYILSDSRLHLAFYTMGWICSFNIKELGKQASITEELQSELKSTTLNNEINVFKTKLHTKLYFRIFEGVVIVSNIAELIEKATKTSQAKLENGEEFKKYQSAIADKTILSMFIHHDLFKRFENNDKPGLNTFLQSGSSMANIDFQPSQVTLNGYFNPGPKEIITMFKKQSPQKSKVVCDYLPAGVVSFTAYGFNDYANLRADLDGNAYSQNFWELVNKKALFNLKSEFEKNCGNELISFKFDQNLTEVISIGVKDTLLSKEHLPLLSDTLLKQDSIPIFQLDSLNALHLFEPVFSVKTIFVTRVLSQLYFCENKEVLVQCVKRLKAGLRLNEDESYLAYQNEHFPDEYNLLIYVSPNHLKNNVWTALNLNKNIKSDPFENLKHFSFCASAFQNQFKFRMQFMNETERKATKEQFLWTLNLDTTAIIGAQPFVNHMTQENEFIIQDAANSLYLINAKGNILWKKKLNEPVRSKIHVVDIYKNGKYQILFNTENALHLIDRNSDYVETYPIKLPAAATNAMSLFDYENDKEYRILIACKNNTIYNYTIHGQKQEKFLNVKTDDEVQLPIQYVKIGLSDYLVAIDVEGKIYTFSRKGVGRIGLRNRTVVNCKVFYCDLNNSIATSYIVYMDDRTDQLNKISFDDRKEIIKLNMNLAGAEAKFRLIDENRNMDLLLTKDNSEYSFNFSGNLIREVNYTEKLRSGDCYKDESHSFYYGLNESGTKIYYQNLLNRKVQEYQATQLPAVSNLFKDNKTYLIISNGAQLTCVPAN